MKIREQLSEPMRKPGCEGSCMAVCRPASATALWTVADGSQLLLSLVLLLQGRGQHHFLHQSRIRFLQTKCARSILLAVCAWRLKRFDHCPLGAAVPTNVRSPTADSGLNPLSLSLAVIVERGDPSGPL